MNKPAIVYFIFLFSFLCITRNTFAQGVTINEVMASNRDIIYDEDGDSPDWIEIHNSGISTVNIGGWGISDDTIDLNKWVFPDINLEPDQFLLIFASGKDSIDGANLHADFKIKGGHDQFVLFNDEGEIEDKYPAICIPTNISLGYQPDGSGERYYFSNPSPGYSNNLNLVTSINIVQDTIMLSHKSGYYKDPIQLAITKTSDLTRIYYTIDGSIPDDEAYEYTDPLELNTRAGNENVFSEIRTGPFWEPPNEEIKKVNVIRAIAMSDGCPASELISNTYAIDRNFSNRYPCPVISIMVDRSDFFGKKKGIYVPGLLQAFEGDISTGNYFQSGSDWERTIHLEFFNQDGTLAFEHDAGARTHGRGSRKLAQKTLKIYEKEKYGNEVLNYQLFPQKEIDTFKTFMIRSTLGDISGTFFKDELCHDLVSGLNMDVQSYRPCVVFINGEYWGLQNLRERQDKYYIGYNHNTAPDDLDIIALSFSNEEIVEGDNLDYHALLDFIDLNEITEQEIYDSIKSWMDINNYIDYYISQLYLANFDWPVSNIKYWRSRTEDNRWRWLFFDCDWCLIRSSYDHLLEYTIEDERYPRRSEVSTFLFRSLLQNPEFRDQFNSRFIYLLNTTFRPENVIQKIDEFKQIYAPLVTEHIHRWNQPKSFDHWLENIESLKHFAFVRPATMMNQLSDHLDIPYTIYPNPASTEFYIETSLPEGMMHSLEIFNMNGIKVLQKSTDSTSELESVPVPVSKLAQGIYLIRLQYGNSIFYRKLVIR
jgi:hypothetical protein